MPPTLPQSPASIGSTSSSNTVALRQTELNAYRALLTALKATGRIAAKSVTPRALVATTQNDAINALRSIQTLFDITDDWVRRELDILFTEDHVATPLSSKPHTRRTPSTVTTNSIHTSPLTTATTPSSMSIATANDTKEADTHSSGSGAKMPHPSPHLTADSESSDSIPSPSRSPSPSAVDVSAKRRKKKKAKKVRPSGTTYMSERHFTQYFAVAHSLGEAVKSIIRDYSTYREVSIYARARRLKLRYDDKGRLLKDNQYDWQSQIKHNGSESEDDLPSIAAYSENDSDGKHRQRGRGRRRRQNSESDDSDSEDSSDSDSQSDRSGRRRHRRSRHSDDSGTSDESDNERPTVKVEMHKHKGTTHAAHSHGKDHSAINAIHDDCPDCIRASKDCAQCRLKNSESSRLDLLAQSVLAEAGKLDSKSARTPRQSKAGAKLGRKRKAPAESNDASRSTPSALSLGTPRNIGTSPSQMPISSYSAMSPSTATSIKSPTPQISTSPPSANTTSRDATPTSRKPFQSPLTAFTIPQQRPDSQIPQPQSIIQHIQQQTQQQQLQQQAPPQHHQPHPAAPMPSAVAVSAADAENLRRYHHAMYMHMQQQGFPVTYAQQPTHEYDPAAHTYAVQPQWVYPFQQTHMYQHPNGAPQQPQPSPQPTLMVRPPPTQLQQQQSSPSHYQSIGTSASKRKREEIARAVAVK